MIRFFFLQTSVAIGIVVLRRSLQNISLHYKFIWRPFGYYTSIPHKKLRKVLHFNVILTLTYCAQFHDVDESWETVALQWMLVLCKLIFLCMHQGWFKIFTYFIYAAKTFWVKRYSAKSVAAHVESLMNWERKWELINC